MLEASIDFAEQDFEDRQRIEARIEADAILTATTKALQNAGEADLPGAERAAIEKSAGALRSAAAGQDYKLMRQRIDELNQATNHLAELVMNGALQSAFEGKRLDDV